MLPPITAWPPELIFLCACGVAAIGGLGRLFGSTQPLTFRNVAHAVLVHGTVGGGLAGVGYTYLGWEKKPLAMLGFAALYGGGIISPRIVALVAENALGMLKSGGSSANDDEK